MRSAGAGLAVVSSMVLHSPTRHLWREGRCLWSTKEVLWGTLWDRKFVAVSPCGGGPGRHRTLPTDTASAGSGIGSDEQFHSASLLAAQAW